MKSKLIILLLLTFTGCTTVYKVDSKGICRAPDGKVVKEADVNPDRFCNYTSTMRVGVGGPRWYNWQIKGAEFEN
jgi:hypothetical protein